MKQVPIDRRGFLAAAAASSWAMPSFAGAAADAKPKRIAFLGTEVREHSHAQHFLDRLTQGYAWGGRWTKPRVEIASVYIDQFPSSDLARHRIAKHSLRKFPSIAEALTLGGSTLAVDGVVIIAEHGNYPKNEKGQTRYPRYRWFKEVVEIFEASRRAVPVFNDKHLSTDWAESVEMVADAKRLGFPFLAGSSLPVTWRLPSIDMRYDAELTESVCVAYGGIDSYDFHALETAQCMSERRRGGEVGIKTVHALRGDAMWNSLEGDGREITRRLFVAALSRSHNLPVEGGFPTAPVTCAWAREALPDTLGYFIEHRDGFRTSIFLADIRDFNYAGYLPHTDDIVSCQMYLPMPNHGSTTADFFNPLTRHIETLILEKRAPYPVERTLLTTGVLDAVMHSLADNGRRRETPELTVAYKPADWTFANRDE